MAVWVLVWVMAEVGVPVLMVHGIWDRGSIFSRLRRPFEAAGRRVVAPDLTPCDARHGLRPLAEQLETVVAREFSAGERIDLVGFSMGGIVARLWLQELGGVARVRRLVTVASPHHGTRSAHLYWGGGARDMRPGSALLRELNDGVRVLAGVPWLSIYTRLDLMILPPCSSRPPGELPLSEVRVNACPIHALMPYWPSTHRWVGEFLEESSQ